LRLKQTALFI